MTSFQTIQPVLIALSFFCITSSQALASNSHDLDLDFGDKAARMTQTGDGYNKKTGSTELIFKGSGSSGGKTIAVDDLKVTTINEVRSDIIAGKGAQVSIGDVELSDLQANSITIDTRNTVVKTIDTSDGQDFELGTVKLKGFHGNSATIKHDNFLGGYTTVQSGSTFTAGNTIIGSTVPEHGTGNNSNNNGNNKSNNTMVCGDQQYNIPVTPSTPNYIYADQSWWDNVVVNGIPSSWISGARRNYESLWQKALNAHTQLMMTRGRLVKAMQDCNENSISLYQKMYNAQLHDYLRYEGELLELFSQDIDSKKNVTKTVATLLADTACIGAGAGYKECVKGVHFVYNSVFEIIDVTQNEKTIEEAGASALTSLLFSQIKSFGIEAIGSPDYWARICDSIIIEAAKQGIDDIVTTTFVSIIKKYTVPYLTSN